MSTADACVKCGHQIDTEDGFELYAPDAARSGDGYNPNLYHEIAALEDRNFWFQARNNLIVHAIRKYCSDLGSFLEIGCGTGQVLRAIGAFFPAIRISGSELFLEGLKFARQRVPGAHLMQMDATRIPFEDEFDAIGAFDVVEHIHDDRRVLTQIHKALKQNGTVILTVPQHQWLWSRQDELAHHQRRYRRGELEQKLGECGFKVVYSTSFVSILLPLLVLSRLVVRPHDTDPLREMRIDHNVNLILGAALKLEFQFLRAGVRLPIGGTRLVVARKKA